MCSVFMNVISELLKKVYFTVVDYSLATLIIRLRFLWRGC